MHPFAIRPAALARAAAVVLAATFLAPSGADAQLGRLKDKLKEKARDAVSEAVVCVVTDTECIQAAEAEGREVSYTDEEGNPVDPPAATEGEPAAGTDAAPGKPGEGAWANFDFVPGERVLFAEDFTRERVGNFPRRLVFHDGNLEVVEWQGRRWLRANPGGLFEIPLPETLPERFTVEFDVTVPWQNLNIWGRAEENHDHTATDWIGVGATFAGIHRARGASSSGMDPRDLFPALNEVFAESWLSQPVRIRIMADGGYVKIYMDEQRVSNIPNAAFARSTSLFFRFDDNNEPPLIGDIVIAASDVTMYDALEADGRVAVQGILFDTGSDRIRPESSGTLSEIAMMLEEHADLALTIEGHTDNVGDAAANQSLSQRRAAAVKAVLVGTYGIDAGRLDAAGFGASKPAADNGTPEGRQQNRRVELVRR